MGPTKGKRRLVRCDNTDTLRTGEAFVARLCSHVGHRVRNNVWFHSPEEKTAGVGVQYLPNLCPQRHLHGRVAWPDGCPLCSLNSVYITNAVAIRAESIYTFGHLAGAPLLPESFTSLGTVTGT